MISDVSERNNESEKNTRRKRRAEFETCNWHSADLHGSTFELWPRPLHVRPFDALPAPSAAATTHSHHLSSFVSVVIVLFVL